MKIIISTHNTGKLHEIRSIFAHLALPFECISSKEAGLEDVEETGQTFVENALLKARHAAHITDLPALADDSGLVVPSLNGQPGIYSARFSGKHGDFSANIQKLLLLMKNKVKTDRAAYFYCAMVFLTHAADPTPIIALGKWEGEIAKNLSGTQGFGYDPVFYLPTLQCTAAELDPHHKNTISHRALAMHELKSQLSHIIIKP